MRASAERWILELCCGPSNPEGQWLDVDAPHSNLVAAFGVLFEDNYGPLAELRNATFQPTCHSGKPRR